MSESGQQQLEALQKDLACPNCEYNLRGLYGDIVNCPECGHECDIPYLLTRKWEGPWYKAPGYTKLSWPVAWAVLSFWIIIFIPEMTSAYYSLLSTSFSICLIGCTGIWLLLMWQVWYRHGQWWGVCMSMIQHIVIMGYMIGFIGILTMVVYLVLGIGGSDVQIVLYAFMFFALFCLIWWACRQGEKFVAKQCIRRYLNQPPAAD